MIVLLDQWNPCQTSPASESSVSAITRASPCAAVEVYHLGRGRTAGTLPGGTIPGALPQVRTDPLVRLANQLWRLPGVHTLRFWRQVGDLNAHLVRVRTVIAREDQQRRLA